MNECVECRELRWFESSRPKIFTCWTGRTVSYVHGYNSGVWSSREISGRVDNATNSEIVKEYWKNVSGLKKASGMRKIKKRNRMINVKLPWVPWTATFSTRSRIDFWRSKLTTGNMKKEDGNRSRIEGACCREIEGRRKKRKDQRGRKA